MRRILLVLAVIVTGCVQSPPDLPVDSGLEDLAFGFAPSVVIDPAGMGTEPSILATKDGAVYVSSVLGSATRRGDGVWKSTDGGATWASLGLPDYPFGGGDSDLEEDAAGTIYLTGQWRPAAIPGYYVTGGESVAVSRDQGATWRIFPVASGLPVTDRQWLATHGAGTVYLAFNQAHRGLVVTKSTDSGTTWTQLTSVPGTWDPGDGVAVPGGPNGIPGDILVDPRDGALFLPYASGIGGGSRDHRLFVSTDGGKSFQVRKIHTPEAGLQPSAIFGTLGLDAEGRLYYAWSEGSGSGFDVFLRTSEDRGGLWSDPIRVSTVDETAVMPWLTVGAPGRVAVAYYAAAGRFSSDGAPSAAEWYPKVALFPDLFEDPDRIDERVLAASNHAGPICTGGTGCDPQFRRLGDFFEIALTPKGQVVAVWADDTGLRLSGDRPVQDPAPTVNVFARQVTGSLL